jgi:DNA-directed RNA polymerase subunit RPC12/RpoP
MSDDRHLDGNSLGGLLYDVFGHDMTADFGRCANCGATNPLGATRVYLDAPGYVMRCPACQGVLMVVVETPRTRRVSFELLSWVDIGIE